MRFDTALPSAVARALIVAGASLLVACGSAESDRTAAPTTSSSVAPPATQEERPRAAHLLALTGEGLNSLVVLDPESGDEQQVPLPAELDGERAQRAVVSPDGQHVFLTVGDAAVLWDRTTNATTVLGYGERIIGLHPSPSPSLLLVRTNRAMLVVDLDRGRVHDITEDATEWADGIGARILSDRDGAIAVVAAPFGGAIVVELDSGTMHRHDDELLFGNDALSAGGAFLLGRRSSDFGFTVEVLDALVDEPATVWFTPPDRTAQVQPTWVGDRVIAIDLSGRIMDITDGGDALIAEVPPWGDDGLVNAVLQASRDDATSVVIEDRLPDAKRWFHLDLDSGDLVELTELDGYERLGARDGNPISVGLGDQREGFESIRLLDIADGSVVTLHDGVPSSMFLRDHGFDVFELVEQDGGFRSTFFDASGRRLSSIRDATRTQVDAKAGIVAFSERNVGSGEPLDLSTWVVTIDGTTVTSFADTAVLALLPSL